MVIISCQEKSMFFMPLYILYVYGLVHVIVLPKLLQNCSWFITCIPCLKKCDINNISWKPLYSLVHRLGEQYSFQCQMNHFDIGMKVIHKRGLAWSFPLQQKNIEWDALSKQYFLCLWYKVVEKPVLETYLCDPGFGVTLPYNRKRAFGYVFQDSWVLWMIN